MIALSSSPSSKHPHRLQEFWRATQTNTGTQCAQNRESAGKGTGKQRREKRSGSVADQEEHSLLVSSSSSWIRSRRIKKQSTCYEEK